MAFEFEKGRRLRGQGLALVAASYVRPFRCDPQSWRGRSAATLGSNSQGDGMNEDLRPSSLHLSGLHVQVRADRQRTEGTGCPTCDLRRHRGTVGKGVRRECQQRFNQGCVLVGAFLRVRLMFPVAGIFRRVVLMLMPVAVVAERELSNTTEVAFETPCRLDHMRPSHRQNSNDAEEGSCGLSEGHDRRKETVGCGGRQERRWKS